ncbi:flagellar biosynthetic protein FliR [Oceanotoga teriensis]|uniref:flagellar biosynthetic protein FliR n=1 Tax=Oceanotoga teriensis TaxID=515440 RepID=UPI00271428F0|nr:flagellar biosynthetic protein FliR [Oceanotoga teriensis]MDO7977346.1 flagellar biosynthetic protein FliR [Oceanotoga teriensis]
MELLSYKLWIYFFILTRLIGTFFYIPFINSNMVPRNVKIFIAIFLSYLILLNDNSNFPIDSSAMLIVYYLIVNFIIGITIGIVTNLIFYAVQFAGEFIGVQLGFAMANVLDPTLNEEVSILSQFSYIFVTFSFFIFKGHILIYNLFIESFNKVPVLFKLNGENYLIIASKISDILLIGLQFSMPIIAFMIFIKIALGIISRLMPQMNVFMVGLPLNVLVGFIIYMVVIVSWNEQFTKLFFEMYHWIENTMILLSK